MIDQARAINNYDADAAYHATPKRPPLPGDGEIVHGTCQPGEPVVDTWQFLWGAGRVERQQKADAA